MRVQKLEKSVDNNLNKPYRMGVVCTLQLHEMQSTWDNKKTNRQLLYYVKNVDIDSDNVMDRRILP